MNKTNIKSEFYGILSELEYYNISIVGIGNENFNHTPLIAYNISGKIPLIVQNNIERFTEWLFFVKIYTDSSVQCTELSDDLDEKLMKLGFIELDFDDGYDKTSGKFYSNSLYSIKLDENGYSYTLK